VSGSAVDMEKVFGLRRRFSLTLRAERESRPPTPAHKNVRARPFSAPPAQSVVWGVGEHSPRQTDAHKRTAPAGGSFLGLSDLESLSEGHERGNRFFFCSCRRLGCRRSFGGEKPSEIALIAYRAGIDRGTVGLLFFRISCSLLVCTLNHLTWTRTKSALFNIHLFIIRRALSIITPKADVERRSGDDDKKVERLGTDRQPWRIVSGHKIPANEVFDHL
jgi:hypothetical protein